MISEEDYNKVCKIDAEIKELETLLDKFSRSPNRGRYVLGLRELSSSFPHNLCNLKTEGAERFQHLFEIFLQECDEYLRSEIRTRLNTLNIQRSEYIGDPSNVK